MFLLNHTALAKFALEEKQTCMCSGHTSEYTIVYSLKGIAFYCLSCFSKLCEETIRREINFAFLNALFKYMDTPRNKMCLSCSTVVFMKQSSPCPKCGFTRWVNVDGAPHARAS